MESLNLNTLVNSLPAQANAEKELLNDFKAAALSITTLYRSSRNNAKRAYNAGYATACQDLLNFIQHNVSVEGNDGSNPSGMVSRVMDWTEARLDAIRATEEDEEEDEERENAGASKGANAKAQVPTKKVTNAAASTSALPTPRSPTQISSARLPLQQPSSPSPPPATTLRPHYHRLNKLRAAGTGPASTVPFLSTQSTSIPSSITPTALSPEPMIPSSLDTVYIGAGAKRRHAVMMVESPGAMVTPSPASAEGTARRRTRSTKSLGVSTVHNQNLGTLGSQQNEDMDVEEDGRERKRVARR